VDAWALKKLMTFFTKTDFLFMKNKKNLDSSRRKLLF